MTSGAARIPSLDGASAKAWRFIIRNAERPDLPYAFQPHVRYCAWISTPTASSTRFFVRGYVQFTSDRKEYTLYTRYCKTAEWYSSNLQDMRVFNQFQNDPIPLGTSRYFYGIPHHAGPCPPTIPMHRVGFGVEVPDLTEDYAVSMWMQENEATPEYGDDFWDDYIPPDFGEKAPGRDRFYF